MTIHSLKKRALLICTFIFSVLSQFSIAQNYAALRNIDAIKEAIGEVAPEVAPEHNECYQDLHQQLEDFLDTNNNESYATHIAKIQASLNTFKSRLLDNPAYNDKRFKIFRFLTKNLYNDLVALTTILAGFIRTPASATTIALKLKSYAHLLPKKIKSKYGELGLLNCLSHRLSC